VHCRLRIPGLRTGDDSPLSTSFLRDARETCQVEAGLRELFISTERDQTNGVLVAVRDSGPGIYPEHLERVFEAFYTTKSSGVGMGCRFAGPLSMPMGADEVMNSSQAAYRNEEPREDTVSDASHQLACEGNKRFHPSERETGRLHRGKPSRGLSESRVQLR
jgi:hypothetical protein